MNIQRVAIIGGGWSGCAAAVELSHRGHHTTLFESARTLGGRARCVELHDKTLDNGQHILLGAYAETLRLMRMVGIDTDEVLLRLPLQMRYPENSGGMDFIAPRLPAPFHMLVALIRARGLALEDKLSLARFSTTARWMDWRLNVDCSVTELLDRFDQTPHLIKLLWRPLCLAALNTPLEIASAQVFLNVLHDSLGGARSASDMLIPRVDLTTLFPQKAVAFIERHGGHVYTGSTIEKITQNGTHWRLNIAGQNADPRSEQNFDAIVIATQANQATQLLDDVMGANTLQDFSYQPITTCYLQYGPGVKLGQPFFALPDDAATGHWGQFVFDRGALNSAQPGLLAVVISASTEAIALEQQILADAVATQLAQVLQQPELKSPVWTKIISEKRATFSCTPELIRPKNLTALTGLVLAGDYTASEYPATLESAARSGVAAARCLIE